MSWAKRISNGCLIISQFDQFYPHSMNELIELLPKIKLEKVCFRDKDIGDNGILSLTFALAQNVKIQGLVFDNINMTDLGVDYLMHALVLDRNINLNICV